MNASIVLTTHALCYVGGSLAGATYTHAHNAVSFRQMSEARYVTFQVVGNVNVYYAVITVNGYYRTKYYCQRSISVNYCTTRKAAVRYDTGLLYRVAQKTEGTLFDCYII